MTVDDLVDKLVQIQQKGNGAAEVYTTGSDYDDCAKFLVDIDEVQLCNKNDISNSIDDCKAASSDPFVVLT